MDSPTQLQPTSQQESYLQSVQHVSMGMAPRNLEEGMRLSQLLSKSTIVPKEYQGNPGNCFIALQMGAELGLMPGQALQSICVINGKPSLYGDALPAVVYVAKVFDPAVGIKETFDAATGTASCTVKRKDSPDPVTRTFSIENAKKAGLWGKTGPWTQYPERMLQMRARAFALRDAFPDVLRGLAVAEEMQDVVDAEAPVKVDPIVAMQTEIGADGAQFTFIQNAWDELNVSHAGRLVQCKRFSGNADGLIEMLVSMGATITPKAILADPDPPKAKRTRTPKPSPSPEPVVEPTTRDAVLLGAVGAQECPPLTAEEQAELDAEAAKQSGDKDDLPF